MAGLGALLALGMGLNRLQAVGPSARGCAWRTEQAMAARPLAPVHASQSWRFGVGVSTAVDQDYWAPRLGATWYLNWQATDRIDCAWLAHWQMVRVHAGDLTPTLTVVRRLAQKHPGQTWIIGNEPDVIVQDGVTSERYAEAYHDLYTAIKAVDPSARVAAGAVGQATPLRLKYLDQVLAAYTAHYGGRMPVDVWTVHGYVLNESSTGWGAGIPPGLPDDLAVARSPADHGRLDLFAEQLRAFRGWMTVHGYRDRPLALTEFGILLPPDFGYTPGVVAQYLRGAFDYLLTAQDPAIGYRADQNHLVQSWAWFSLADATYPVGNLVDPLTGELTSAGLAYRDYVRRLARAP